MNVADHIRYLYYGYLNASPKQWCEQVYMAGVKRDNSRETEIKEQILKNVLNLVIYLAYRF